MKLVVGATGVLGRQITSLFAEASEPVRAVVRPTSDPAAVQALQDAGAELVQADLKDPASLRRACTGVDTVVTTATTTLRDQQADPLVDVDHLGQLNLVSAARDAGVRHFGYVSYPEAMDGPVRSPLSTAKRAVEAALQHSGMVATVVQPGVFMDVWLSPVLGFDPIAGRVRVLGSGEAPIGWITVADVARGLVASLIRFGQEHTVLPLVGEQLSMNEVIRTFETVQGRPFEVEHVSEDALAAQQQAARTPLDQSFAALMIALARGAWVPRDPRQAELGFSMTTVRAYAQRVSTLVRTAPRSEVASEAHGGGGSGKPISPGHHTGG
ncbi:SDR family oxidoreductase [Deinococcus hohokamensis]|uniref:SDR family oxidoreductase n=1 Tax=Deinococcus hohokamensis TaxID=309883 RepID=A0ABV9I963_9DEIO